MADKIKITTQFTQPGKPHLHLKFYSFYLPLCISDCCLIERNLPDKRLPQAIYSQYCVLAFTTIIMHCFAIIDKTECWLVTIFKAFTNLGDSLPNTFFFFWPYLTDDIFVCETNNHPVLWCIVFIFILNNKSLSCKVICLTLCNVKSLCLHKIEKKCVKVRFISLGTIFIP